MKSLKKVLYIDSDNSLCTDVQKALSNSSFHCIIADSGSSGLKKSSDNTFDIIFVDERLSDMSAEDFIIKIHSQNNHKNIPFILLTSSGTTDKSTLNKQGFYSHFNKPFHTNDLINFINKIIISNFVCQNNDKFQNTMNNGKYFLENVLESSVESIFTADNKGYITYCNKASIRLLKYKFKELIGLNISELLNDGSSELLKIFNTVNKDGKLTNYKTFLIDKTKNKIPVSLSLSPMKDINGNVIGCLALTMHQKEDVDNSSMQRSERLATILETAITVNHAINNPLVPILGHAQFLLQDERITDEDIRKRLNIIIDNALRIKNITQKLARISKPVSKEYIKGTKMLDLDASI